MLFEYVTRITTSPEKPNTCGLNTVGDSAEMTTNASRDLWWGVDCHFKSTQHPRVIRAVLQKGKFKIITKFTQSPA